MSVRDSIELGDQGDRLKQAGKIEAAIDCYQQAIELAPNNYLYYFKLGELFKEQEQIVNASIYYCQAIKIEPNKSWAYHGLAEVLTQQNKLEEAINYYRQAITLNPDFSWSHYNLGRIFHQLESLEDAKLCYQQAISLDSSYSWAYYFLADILVRQDQFEAAISYYQQAIKLAPDCLTIYDRLGETLLHLESLATKDYRQLDFQSDLEKAYVEVSLGRAWEKQQQSEQAIKCYEKAIEVEPSFDLPHQLINRVYGTAENPKNYQKFLILCHPRTGSNFLVSLLESHPQIRAFGEVFTEDNNIYWGYSGYRSPQILQLRYDEPIAFVDKLVYRHFPPIVKAVGFKLFYFHPKHEHQKIVWQYLKEIENLKIIHLTRKNILHTYVSHEIAFRTDRWTLLADDKDDRNRYLSEPIILDYQECLDKFKKIRSWETEYSNFFDLPTQGYYNLVYEELVSNLERETNRLQEFLGVQKHLLNPKTKKRNQKPIREIVANYDRLKEQFQNSCWSEFFDE